MTAVMDAIDDLDTCLDRVELLAMAATAENGITAPAKCALLQGALDLKNALTAVRNALSDSVDLPLSE